MESEKIISSTDLWLRSRAILIRGVSNSDINFGAFDFKVSSLIFVHSFLRYEKSAIISSSSAEIAFVLIMMDIPSGKLKPSWSFFNLFLSFGFDIFLETPPFDELLGSKTLYLPGSEINVVIAAPLFPLSSLTI